MIKLWKDKVSFLLGALGMWVLCAPVTFGYGNSLIGSNDEICGALLLFTGMGCKKTGKKGWFLLAIAIGLWMQLAPLFFWAKAPIAYANGTLVGVAVIFLAFQGIVGREEELEDVEEVPPGWSFNPSAYKPRVFTGALAVVSWFLARYLAAYQLGYIDQIYDPLTGGGTLKVITSNVAKAFPVSDAGLGAFGYTLDFLLAVVGSCRRWRTMPWLAVFFGLMVVPAGCVSVLLIILQPILVKAWCGLCLLIAVCMLGMIVLTLPEVFAVAQLLKRVKAEKRGALRVFWRGISSAELQEIFHKQVEVRPSMGVGFSWNLVALILCGAGLMLFPSLFSMPPLLADINYVVGPLVIAVSAIALAEVARGVRKLNLLLGAVILLSSFCLLGSGVFSAIAHLIFGLGIIVLSFPKGKILSKYG